MRSSLLYLSASFLIAVATAASCVSTIRPDEMTHSAIGETMVRIHMHVSQRREYPKDLSLLPKRNGYANEITDGWGRPLIYHVDQNGVISLKSLGRDGKEGGGGLDQDI